MIRTSSSRAACFVALLTIARAGAADPTAADVATAKSLVVEGRTLRSKGNHKTARDRFRAAFALVPTPIIGMDLAREHEALAELIEARDVALSVTKLAPLSKESDESKTARADATKLANELATRIPSVVVQMQKLPSGARLTIDGAPLPPEMLGVPRKVNPGKHKIVLQVGESAHTTTTVVEEGDSKDVEIAAPATASESPTPSPDREASAPLWPWVVGGIGAAAVVGGGIYGLGKNSRLNDCALKCNENEISDLKGDRTVGYVIAGVGAGAVGVAVVGLVLGGPKADAKPIAVHVGPGHVTWSVRF